NGTNIPPVINAPFSCSPALVLDDTCTNNDDLSRYVMGKAIDLNSIPNLHTILTKEGFVVVQFSYLGGLWVLIEVKNETTKQKLLQHTGANSWFHVLQDAIPDFTPCFLEYKESSYISDDESICDTNNKPDESQLGGDVLYHPGKANVVADALSKKSGMIAGFKVEEEIIRDLERLGIELYVRRQHGYWASLRVEPDLISRIKEAQKEDSEIWTIVENLDKQVEFCLDDDNVLWQGTRLCVPNDATLREALLTEAHSSSFSVHPGSTNMYHDLKQHFWWSGMKRDVATFVSMCLIYQQDEISMDFVTELPRTQRRHDAIWVVVDRLTKSAHFLPIRKDYSVSKLAETFQQEIVRLHGTLSAIVSDRDPRFVSCFWKGLQKAWRTKLKFSTAFHPQTDCQTVAYYSYIGGHVTFMCLRDQVGERVIEGPEMIESEDPFGFYDLLKKPHTNFGDDTEPSLSHPPSFTPQVSQQETNQNDSALRRENVKELPLEKESSPTVNSKAKSNLQDSHVDETSSRFPTRIHSRTTINGGSILEILDGMIKVGNSMGYDMEGCSKDIERIIRLQGATDGCR
nr:DNA/RNA polymerase superfamily protein [Tanacetum cinerariifolium]